MPLKTRVRRYLFSRLELRLGSFITFHRRPIKSSAHTLASAHTSLPPYAIILQGPIATEYAFTLETVRLYKKLFPDGHIIVSTWEDTPQQDIVDIKAEPGVIVLLNTKPAQTGTKNINYQIASTAAGIKHAHSLGAAYIFKTRTDQRVYATNIYQFVYGLLETFPLHATSVQTKRLVALGMNTVKYRPYSLNDMFMFGTTADMLLYWDIPFDMRPAEKIMTMGQWVSKKMVEAYLMTQFLQKVGAHMNDSLADYWDSLGKYFVIVDSSNLDLYWPKAQRYLEYRSRTYKDSVREDIGFTEWLILYQSLYEKTDAPIYDPESPVT